MVQNVSATWAEQREFPEQAEVAREVFMGWWVPLGWAKRRQATESGNYLNKRTEAWAARWGCSQSEMSLNGVGEGPRLWREVRGMSIASTSWWGLNHNAGNRNGRKWVCPGFLSRMNGMFGTAVGQPNYTCQEVWVYILFPTRWPLTLSWLWDPSPCGGKKRLGSLLNDLWQNRSVSCLLCDAWPTDEMFVLLSIKWFCGPFLPSIILKPSSSIFWFVTRLRRSMGYPERLVAPESFVSEIH